jgi:hypothetical protein
VLVGIGGAVGHSHRKLHPQTNACLVIISRSISLSGPDFPDETKQTATDEMWCDFLTAAAVLGRGDDRRNDCDGNAMRGSLELLNHQLRQIHAAAKILLPSQRSNFVHGVKRRLGHNPSSESAISCQTSTQSPPRLPCSR